MVWIVSRICSACRVDAACGEAGANQKKQRDRHLCDDEAGPEPPSRCAARRRILVDDRYEIDPGTLKCRHESKHDGAAAGDEHRECDHETVDADIEENALGCGELLRVPDEHRNAALCEKDSNHCSRQSEHEIFDDQQPDDSRARRTERQPDGDFAPSRKAADEHEPGDVCARNQQDEEAHRTQDDEARQHGA